MRSSLIVKRGGEEGGRVEKRQAVELDGLV